MSECQRTIIAIDGSKHSERAFQWYVDTMHREEKEVLLVHVHQLPYMPIGLYEDGLLLDSAYQNSIDDSIRASKEILHKYELLCKEKAIKYKCFMETHSESVGHVICKAAHDEKAEFIVIGQRGLGTLRRTLLGSVSDYVLHHAHIPVAVIPPN